MTSNLLKLEEITLKEIKLGEKTVRIRAVAPALLYYKQEFGTDLIGDMVKMMGETKAKENDSQEEAAEDVFALENINFLFILQLTWAMAKADTFGKPFPKFETWLNDYGEDIDFSDESLILEVVEEATKGFFRQSQGVRGAITR